jgi:hypothetical protein
VSLSQSWGDLMFRHSISALQSLTSHERNSLGHVQDQCHCTDVLRMTSFLAPKRMLLQGSKAGYVEVQGATAQSLRSVLSLCNAVFCRIHRRIMPSIKALKKSLSRWPLVTSSVIACSKPAITATRTSSVIDDMLNTSNHRLHYFPSVHVKYKLYP